MPDERRRWVTLWHSVSLDARTRVDLPDSSRADAVASARNAFSAPPERPFTAIGRLSSARKLSPRQARKAKNSLSARINLVIFCIEFFILIHHKWSPFPYLGEGLGRIPCRT